MLDLLAGGVDNYVGFQDELLRLQGVTQRDITALKKTVRRNKDALPALERSRDCDGMHDALATRWRGKFFCLIAER